MFGRNKGEKPDLDCWATYVGGHKAYPKDHTCKLRIYHDRIEITKPELTVPFSAMSKVDYVQAAALGLMGLGKRVISEIEYNDGLETQQVRLEIVDQIGARNLEKAQGMMYSRMLEAKQRKDDGSQS